MGRDCTFLNYKAEVKGTQQTAKEFVPTLDPVVEPKRSPRLVKKSNVNFVSDSDSDDNDLPELIPPGERTSSSNTSQMDLRH